MVRKLLAGLVIGAASVTGVAGAADARPVRPCTGFAYDWRKGWGWDYRGATWVDGRVVEVGSWVNRSGQLVGYAIAEDAPMRRTVGCALRDASGYVAVSLLSE